SSRLGHDGTPNRRVARAAPANPPKLEKTTKMDNHSNRKSAAAVRRITAFLLILLLPMLMAAQTRPAQAFDVIIRGGTVYDGTGGPARRVDVGIRGDRIAGVGNLATAKAATVIDATNLAVAPGFINMLSWSTDSLIIDGRSQGELRQGVTTQIFGEGWSMGPLTEAVKKDMLESRGDLKYDIPWTTLSEYLTYLEKRGVSQNVASFIGATTLRTDVIGLQDKPPTPAQMDKMRELVKREMEAGALGIGSSLIYAPAFYAKTDERMEKPEQTRQFSV